MKRPKKGLLVEKVEKETPEKSANVRTFNVFVDDEYFKVEVDSLDGQPMITQMAPMPGYVPPAHQPQPPAPPTPPKAEKAAPAPKKRRGKGREKNIWPDFRHSSRGTYAWYYNQVRKKM